MSASLKRRKTAIAYVNERAGRAVLVIEGVDAFFRGGAFWSPYQLRASRGRRSLLGAVLYVRGKFGSIDELPLDYLARAIRERDGVGRLLDSRSQIADFNYNNEHRTYRDIEDVVRRARQLALMDALGFKVQSAPRGNHAPTTA